MKVKAAASGLRGFDDGKSLCQHTAYCKTF